MCNPEVRNFFGIPENIAILPMRMAVMQTHCFDFSLALRKHELEDFERVNAYSSADGMVITYRCKIDNRLYDVHVMPRPKTCPACNGAKKVARIGHVEDPCLLCNGSGQV